MRGRLKHRERLRRSRKAGSGPQADDERRGLTDEQLVAMLRNMLLQRQIDNRGFQLNRQGKIPFALGSEGHEALQAGAAMAFARGKDILAPYYRDLGLVLGIGVTPLEMLSLIHISEPTRRTP